MRVVVVSFYYPPDLGAAAFRIQALVEALAASSEQITIDVLTTQPHRYQSFQPEAPAIEREGKINIHRLPVARRAGGKARLAKAYLAFWRHCRSVMRGQQADVVVASASRLVPALVGANLARRLGARLHVDLRDLFALNLSQMHPDWWLKPAHWAIRHLESSVIRRADGLSVASPGFVPYLPESRRNNRCTVHVNGVDGSFVCSEAPRSDSDKPLLDIVYAGNIGRGQALELIVPELAERLRGKAQFTLYGDGGSRAVLERQLQARGLDNVRILAPIARRELPAIYQAADVLFLHLAPWEALAATIPSKLFEYCASGRPVWAGVSGVSAKLLESEVANAAVFRPGDADQGVEALSRLQLCHNYRIEFVDKYARTAIARAMAGDIVALGG